MLQSIVRLRILAFLSVLFLCIAGCGTSVVTRENYDKIKEDMSVSEVEKILGKGQDWTKVVQQMGQAFGDKENVPGKKTLVWQDGLKEITLIFVDDKLKKKSKHEL